MPGRYTAITFENDVKAEGTKPPEHYWRGCQMFENDVKAEGTKPISLVITKVVGLRMM